MARQTSNSKRCSTSGQASSAARSPIVGVERQPVTFQVEGAAGRLAIGRAIEAELEPLTGATGQPTALHDTVFTTIPGSPAYAGKASAYKVTVPDYEVDLQGHNAISGTFRFEA
jgi:hypothetical protein